MFLPGRTLSSWLLALLLVSSLAVAQQSDPPATPLPAGPAATAAPQPVPVAAKSLPQAHPFWDRKNALLFAGVGVFRTLDYTSTRNMRDRGRQEILLSNWVVDNRPLFIGIEAAASGLSIGLSYVMHRTNHHKLERLISIGHISGAAFGDARNYALKSGHHYPPNP
ncbi:MAG TPA: hypothetical protein VKT29_09510 [Terriglobales bacterium]|nr:hypothetical protein [Terriglobales bacterium]